MGLSTEEAFEILELPFGASQTAVIKSYKRLSIKWFPDKHGNSPEALQEFQRISEAILRLIMPQHNACRPMTQIEMLSLFREVFFGSEKYTFASKGIETWDDETQSSDNDFVDDAILSNNDSEDGCARTVSAQEAAKNAEQLIEEEEKEKKKAEKRKAKKKRRKEKRKLEKTSEKHSEEKLAENHEPYSNLATETCKKNLDTKDTNLDSEEDIDTTSAFVAVIAKKKKKLLNLNRTSKNCVPAKESMQTPFVEGPQTDSVVLRSRQLAIRANEMANVGCYQEAVDLFNEAIKLNPTDHRYYGNRSYCYDRLGQYQRALKDAEKSIGLSPQWPKSYFRKGRALTGLKQYASAEKSFEEVLKFDKDSEDALSELAKVRVLQITEMGFPSSVAEVAIAKYGSVQLSAEALLAGVTSKLSINKDDSEVYISDSDSEPGDWLSKISVPSHLKSQLQSQFGGDKKMDPSNPEGHTSLWVGNIKAEVTEKVIINMFSKYGELLSVKLLPEKICAFVNFKDKFGAGQAMKALQGQELLGVNLLIRFPDNSGKAGATLKKNKIGVNNDVTKPKVVGRPVNGDECYFWRTTGCVYTDNCRFKHIKENRGIDMKN